MKQKRYILIEYTDDVIDGPPCNWPEILRGVVKVGNWVDITREKVEGFYLRWAVEEVFFDTKDLDSKAVIEQLTIASDGDDEIPECLSVCEQHDMMDGSATHLLAMIHEIAKSREFDLKELLQLDWSAD